MYLNSFQAYVARQNFKKLPEKLASLEKVRNFYNKELGLENTSSHLYRVTVDDNKKWLRKMKEKNIICGIHYAATHLNPVYNNERKYNCPLSEEVARTTLSIPYNESLAQVQMEYIVENIGQALR